MAERTSPADVVARRAFLKAGAATACLACVPGAGLGARERVVPAGALGQVSKRPGEWFVAAGDGAVQCELCPWRCTLTPGQRARCRVRSNLDGVGQTLAWGNPVLVQEDPVERLPFFHVLPGSRALSLSTAGCNLHCQFCEVWDMALVHPEEVHAYEMSPAEVIEHAGAAQLRAMGFAFGEPVVFYEYMMEIAERAREAGLLNLLQSAAYIEPAPLRALAPLLDAANVDLKGFDERFYREVCGGELAPVLRSLAALKKAGVHLEITTILIPTLNDDSATLQRMCAWIRDELGADVPLHFSRFYPLYKLANLPQTPVSTLDRAREIALDSGLEYVYVAKVTGHPGENTFCPGCGQAVIRRLGFIIDAVHLEDGRCGHCGRAIPGRWH
jgi:pyruvate formate lyase activating enzyme